MELFLLYSHHYGQPQSICKFSSAAIEDGELSDAIGGQDGGPRIHGKSMDKEVTYINAVGGSCLCQYNCLSIGTIQHEIRIPVNSNLQKNDIRT